MFKLRNFRTRILLCGLILFTLTPCISQEIFERNDSSVSISSLKKIMLGVGSGLELEQKVGRTTSMCLFLGFSTGFATSDVGLSALKSKIIISPSTSLAFRKYYSLAKRQQKGKDISNNSGDFVFIHSALYFPAKFQTKSHIALSVGWGMQRRISNKVNMEIQLGITHHTYYYDKSRGPFSKIHPFENLISFSYLL